MVRMTKRLSRENISTLLRSLTEARTRELCIAGLRRWHANPGRASDDLDVASDLLWAGLLREAHGGEHVIAAVDIAGSGLHLTDASMRHVVEFVSWFVRAGFAWPLGAEVDRFPRKLHLTATGHRFLARPDDHPLLSGFVDRLATRCPSLPDGVISALVDATACLDHGLTRPAIVLVGVAYEVAVEHVVDSLVAKATLSAAVANQKAAMRITSVKAVVDQVIQEKDKRFAVHAAYDFADQLRRRRNDAAHTTPTYDFADREEAEEFLVSAGRHLPNLWQMHCSGGGRAPP
jgi:type IV secretory pathway VirB3-like protein